MYVNSWIYDGFVGESKEQGVDESSEDYFRVLVDSCKAFRYFLNLLF